MALRKIHNRYYVYFRDLDGTIRTRSLKVSDKAMAEKLHRQFMLKLQAKKGSLVVMRNFPEDFTPEQRNIKSIAPEITAVAGEHQRGGIAIAKMWNVALTRRELSHTHKIRWDAFVKNIGCKYADQVTPAKALNYLETHYSKGNGKTFNNVRSCLNTVFRCCLVEAGLQQSPFEVVINRRVTSIKPWRNLTLDEFATAFSDAPKYMQIMMMLSRWTAQRLETCAKMTPGMFDFDRKAFIIDPGKTKRFKKWVCCPILPELEQFIKPLLSKCKDSDKTIVSYFKYPGNWSMSEQFSGHLRKHGIDDSSAARVGFHSIRGTAITWFKEHGIQGEELRSITGHTTLQMEDRYARAVANISEIAKNWNM